MTDRLEVAPVARDADTVPGPGERPRVGRSAGRVGLRFWRSSTWKVHLVTFICVGVLWEIGAALWGPHYMATPRGVLAVAPGILLNDTVMWGHFFDTLSAVMVGMTVGCTVGVVSGMLLGRIQWLADSVGPFVNGLYATPMLAVLPIFTLWFGFNAQTRLALIIFAAFPPMAIGAWDGSRSVSKKYLEPAASFGARRRDVWFGIAAPASLPYLIAGWRLSSGRCLVAAVIVEFLATVPGIGYHMMDLTRLFRLNEAIVSVSLLTIVGLVLTIGTEQLVRRLFPWYGHV